MHRNLFTFSFTVSLLSSNKVIELKVDNWEERRAKTCGPTLHFDALSMMIRFFYILNTETRRPQGPVTACVK